MKHLFKRNYFILTKFTSTGSIQNIVHGSLDLSKKSGTKSGIRLLLLTLSLLILSSSQFTGLPAEIISGKVTDETGSPMVGVNVQVKGTNSRTYTDIKGLYQITVSPNSGFLIFSFIGYETKVIPVKGRWQINVRMEPTPAVVNEMAVIGYGTPKKMMVRGGTSVSAPMFTNDQEYYPRFNTENYASIHENGYKKVLDQPLSTFSVDVDRASYANVRRFINGGSLPPIDAVRIEEMINYFNYDYAGPEGDDPFSVYTELGNCPWNHSHQLLHVGLKGKSIEKENLPPSNLVFLIDVSGSMNSENKLGLLKSSFQMLVNELRAVDKVSIVVYAGAAGLVLEPTPGDRKEKILEAIEKLQAGGSTAGGAGLRLAYKIANENLIPKGNNRIILASDGDFNVGVSSNAEMERLVEEEREKGIFITVLGFGMGNYKDDRMEILANKGNGNYAYIDNIQEARKEMISEFGGTLFTIAKDVKFQLEFNPARVAAYRLIGYENRMLNAEDFNNDRKDAGEIGAGHSVTALYEIVPAGSDHNIHEIDPLRYQPNRKEVRPDPNAELLTIKLRYKKPDGEKSILVERKVEGILKRPEERSANFNFSAAVAEFGMLLRDSEYAAQSSFEEVLTLAQQDGERDEEGYRSEFLKLVKTAKIMKEWEAVRQDK